MQYNPFSVAVQYKYKQQGKRIQIFKTLVENSNFQIVHLNFLTIHLKQEIKGDDIP